MERSRHEYHTLQAEIIDRLPEFDEAYRVVRNKSCLPITLGKMEIKEDLEKKLGIPSVIPVSDHLCRPHG